MTDETSVRVCLRIRPQIAREKIELCRVCTSVAPGEPQVLLGSDRAFAFDNVFDMDATQELIYETCVAYLIDGCFDGYNATVLAYGQTGSGKTYTMGTGFDVILAPYEQGIVPRAVKHLFTGMNKRKSVLIENGSSCPDFIVEVQFVELYNEEIIDLLEEGRDIEACRTKKSQIKIREDNSGGIYLTDVTKVPVTSFEETMKVLRSGALTRTTASTNMNVQSSRSHAIFSIFLRQTRQISSATDSLPPEFEILTAKFHFVDLAGSERLKRTGATGERAKEGININSGLLALGNVISALGDVMKRGCHVPYRDSKLTRLIQDSLGGNSRTLMIACISPSDVDFVETLNTLKYANRAKNIKNKVIVNQDRSSRIIGELRTRIQQLELELLKYKQGCRTVDGNGAEPYSDMYQENAMLQNEVSQLRTRLKALHNTLETYRLRNVQVLTEQATQLHTKSIKNSENAENSENFISDCIRKYIEEIEELKARLCESEETCEILNRQLRKYKGAANTTNIGVSPLVAGNQLAYANWSGMSFSCVDAFDDVSICSINQDQPSDVKALISEAKSEIESLKDKTEVASNSLNENCTNEEADDDDESDDAKEQICQNLATLQNEITLKERLVEQLELSQKRLHALKTQYDEKLTLLQRQIAETELERDRALALFGNQIKTLHDQAKADKIRGEYEEKLRNMKNELHRLQSASKEHQRLIKQQQENTRRLSKLQNELMDMKNAKVLLLRKMKEESNRMRQVELKRAKEVAQFQKDARRKDIELRSLKLEKEKREAVLKRKQDEVQALRKMQQKKFSANVAKSNVASFKGSGDAAGSALNNTYSAKISRQRWLNLEKNMLAQIRKKQTVSQMEQEMERHMQERENLHKQLVEIKAKLRSFNNNNNNSSKMTDGVNDEVILRKEESDQMESLQANMDYVQDMITDCQKQIMDVEDSKEESEDAGTDPTFNFDSLEEAKYIIQNLFNFSITQGVCSAQREASIAELNAKLQQVQSDYSVHEKLLRHVMGHNPEIFGLPENSAFDVFAQEPLNNNESTEFNKSDRLLRSVKARRRRTATPGELLYTDRGEPEGLPAQLNLPVVKEADSPQINDGSRTRNCSPSSPDDRNSQSSERHSSEIDSSNQSNSKQPNFLSSAKSSSALEETSSGSNDGTNFVRGRSERSSYDSEKRSTTSLQKSPTAGVISPYPVENSSKNSPLICTHVAHGHTKAVLTVDATDSLLVSGSKDRTARLWDLEKCINICTFSNHPNNVLCVRLCPELQLLFSASMSHVKIWDIRTEACVKTLSSSGLTLDGDVAAANNAQGRQMTVAHNESLINQIELNTERSALFTSAYNQIRIWDLRNFVAVGKLVSATVNPKCEVSSFTLFSRGTSSQQPLLNLVAGSRDHYIKIFNLTDRSLRGVYEPKHQLEPPHYDGITCLTMVNDFLFSGSRDQHLVKWDLDSNRRVIQLTNAHRDWILSLSNLPGRSGRDIVVSACRSGFIKLWDSVTCTNMGEVRGHPSAIYSLAHNSQCLFTASHDCSIGVWKPRADFEISSSI